MYNLTDSSSAAPITDATPKIIAVVGATGSQGGSIANKFLKLEGWHVRAITRNPSSGAAKALWEAGAEIVTADADDEESLKKAFDGAHAIFAVTNFWEHMFRGCSSIEAGEKELAQGKNLARAAAQTSTLEHYLWSTMSPVSEMTNGRFPCPHWDYKAMVDHYIRREWPELAAKTTFMVFGWYPSNMVTYPMFKPVLLPGADKYVWMHPCAPSAPLAIAGDMQVNPGVWASQILAHPDRTKGRYLSVATEVMTVGDVLNIWSKATGKDVVYVEVSAEAFIQMWGPFGAEMVSQLQMNEVVYDWEAFRKADFVRPGDIGIDDSNMIGLQGALESLKSRLL